LGLQKFLYFCGSKPKTMKNIIFAVCISFVSFSGFTQTKTGTIDVDYIILQMPEIEGIQKNLKEYGESLDKQLEVKIKAYQEKLEDYNTNVNSFTEQQKLEKQTAIFTLEEDINKFRQNGIQLIRLREDDLKRPLFLKIANALDAVASEQNYTQVFNTSTDNNIVFLDPNYDITFAVLDKLGIKVEIED
jgi:outer membrane protein